MLFEAVADLLRRIAGDDVLVVMLDDLHWAEPTALSLLRHLVRALADAPVLLIVMFFLGIAAGFRNVLRTAREMNKSNADKG